MASSGRRTGSDASTADRLRAAGLRATGPRSLILETLGQDRTHPTPERLLERLRDRYPSLSLSTVYQTLDAFVKVGLCRRVNAGDGRIRVDGTPRDHDHAVCRACGSIHDLQRRSPRVPPRGEIPDGWTLLDVRVEYDVVCAACAAEGVKSLR